MDLVDFLICPGFSSSWGIQLNNWFAAVFQSSLSPVVHHHYHHGVFSLATGLLQSSILLYLLHVFSSLHTYEFKPNALTNWVQYFSGGRPLLHFFPIPSSSRWCSILSCLIMCPIIIMFLLLSVL
uniref:Uncharacterized protein n=1 Tax=Cacopsylla melanoneura TaxID=428564 RepID=A0A8D8X4W8_9HEMI